MSAISERGRRATAGRRMSSLVGKALEDDETFWNHDTWNDDDEDSGNDSFRESDEDSVNRKDQFDSDFDDSESDHDDEEEAAGQEEEDRIRREEKRAKKKKSFDVAKAGRELMQKRKGRGKVKVKGSRVFGDGANAGLVLNFPTSAGATTSPGIIRRHVVASKVAPAATKDPKTTLAATRARRTSQKRLLRTSTQEKSQESSKQQPKTSTETKKRKVQRFTQEELLLEAITVTEPENERWLLGRKRLHEQAEATQRAAAAQAQTTGKILQRFISRRGYFNTLSFPEMDAVPEILTRMATNAKPQPVKPTYCVITGKRARYKDPKTGKGYSDLSAFRELRRRLQEGEPLNQLSLVKEKKPAFVKEKKPVLAKDKKPVPVKDMKSVPNEEKLPVSAKDKKSLLDEEKKPVPVKDKKPVLAKEKKPTPAKEKKLTPAKDKKPTPAKDKKSTPAKEKKTVAVKDKTPIPVEEKKLVPVEEKKPLPTKPPVTTSAPVPIGPVSTPEVASKVPTEIRAVTAEHPPATAAHPATKQPNPSSTKTTPKVEASPTPVTSAPSKPKQTKRSSPTAGSKALAKKPRTTKKAQQQGASSSPQEISTARKEKLPAQKPRDSPVSKQETSVAKPKEGKSQPPSQKELSADPISSSAFKEVRGQAALPSQTVSSDVALLKAVAPTSTPKVFSSPPAPTKSETKLKQEKDTSLIDGSGETEANALEFKPIPSEKQNMLPEGQQMAPVSKDQDTLTTPVDEDRQKEFEDKDRRPQRISPATLVHNAIAAYVKSHERN